MGYSPIDKHLSRVLGNTWHRTLPEAMAHAMEKVPGLAHAEKDRHAIRLALE